MRILTSYLIRAHVGPFVFALSALTGLLFLNAVAQRLENLAGKGLAWDVILEFLYLSLPHTVALTLPMAVLVAVLYAFSELTANNEVTAMKAGGVRPQRVMLPLLGIGVIIGGVMLYFNDQVLPAANHRLKNLLLDVNRKSPTFVLREQVVNQVRAGETGDVYYLTAAVIDDHTNELEDVAIYDAAGPLARRTTYADRGVMAFNESRTDLYLTLYDGVVLETSIDRPGDFQQVRFERQVLPIRGVGNEMERRVGGSERSDREMSIAMLDSAATERSNRLDSLRDRNLERSRTWVLQALGRDTLELDAAAAATTAESRKGSSGSPLTRVARRLSPGAGAVSPSGRSAPGGAGDTGRAGGATRPGDRGQDAAATRLGDTGRAAAATRPFDTGAPPATRPGDTIPRSDTASTRAARPFAGPRSPGAPPVGPGGRGDRTGLTALSGDPVTRVAANQTNTNWAVENALEDRISRYRVEIHKKYTLAFACVVFVLLGGPLAIRFPRGGLGLVIAASSGIFAIYWAGLIGGESLADRGIAPPAVTMWIPNVVFTALGLWLFLTMGRESATSRGGGWDDVLWSARKFVTRPFGRRASRLPGPRPETSP